MERQRISDEPSAALTLESGGKVYDEDEVDSSLAHISSKGIKSPATDTRKGKAQQVEWDRELDEMTREKAAAEAQWGML